MVHIFYSNSCLVGYNNYKNDNKLITIIEWILYNYTISPFHGSSLTLTSALLLLRVEDKPKPEPEGMN